MLQFTTKVNFVIECGVLKIQTEICGCEHTFLSKPDKVELHLILSLAVNGNIFRLPLICMLFLLQHVYKKV